MLKNKVRTLNSKFKYDLNIQISFQNFFKISGRIIFLKNIFEKFENVLENYFRKVRKCFRKLRIK